MKRSTVIIVSITAVVVIAALLAARLLGLFLPAYTDDLDQFMESRRKAMNIPGMAVGVVGGDGLLWEGYYGSYDGEHPVTEDTLFNIASVSKLFTATAIMQLWEQGEFDLDDDINDYLDFEVRNPNYPEQAITFRQLMTHRSTIADRYPFYTSMYTIESGGGDSPWALGEFLEAYLAPGGEFYTDGNYSDKAPGEKFDYSNYGAALLAYLVEVLSGQDFTVYCQEQIFEPLGMEHSYFLLSDIPDSETELASPFKNGKALPQYGYPDYPAGSLKTTIRDLSRFAAFYLKPAGHEAAILQPETVDLMFGKYGESTDFGEDQMGLIWTHMDWIFLEAVGHTGGDPGVSTSLLLFPDEGFATIMFMNARPSSLVIQRAVNERLWEEGQSLTDR